MVLILDGDSEIGINVRNNHRLFICLRHLISSRAIISRIFSSSPKRPIFHLACATCSAIPSNISTFATMALQSSWQGPLNEHIKWMNLLLVGWPQAFCISYKYIIRILFCAGNVPVRGDVFMDEGVQSYLGKCLPPPPASPLSFFFNLKKGKQSKTE